MTSVLRQVKALLGIYIQDGIAYKASGIIWILTDLSSAVCMPMVMMAAAQGGKIQGMSGPEFILYYLTFLMITSFVTSHFMWEVAMEVKEGQFSSQIIRPVNYLMFMFSRNLAWRTVRTFLFLPMFIILLVVYQPMLGGALPQVTWLGIVSIILGHLLSFIFVMAMAMIALFVQEAMAIFELYYVPMLFLSGAMFPVRLYPEWAQNLAKIFPFYYTTGLPTEIMIGQVKPELALQGIYIQCAWIAGAYVMYKILFAKGTKYYTGVGM
jgi:ABC-2 type transport system permease protein